MSPPDGPVAAIGAAALMTLGADVVTKRLAARRLLEGQLYELAGGCGLRLVHNSRAGLGMLSARRAVIVFVWSMFVTSYLAATVAVGSLTPISAMATGLVVGGVTGNVVDRVHRGAVVDFLAVPRWPVFNLADVAMVTGVALLVRALV
jgi:signal peptidase II